MGLEVAVTVDDLPAHGPLPAGVGRLDLARRFLDTFARHRVPAVYGFVNGKKVDDDPSTSAVLELWRGAGHPLGNHAYSHRDLHASSVADYVADIKAGERVLRALEPAGAPSPPTWKVFRYPFLDEGETLEKRDAVRAYLRANGYAIAEVTIDADDWAYTPPFVRCSARGDGATLAALHASFVEGHLDELRRARALTRGLAGRDVRHVLLLHLGAADADALDDLLTAYEREGVRWIGLTRALADPFYDEDPHLPSKAGAALPYRLAKARGLSAPPPVFARGLEERLANTCP